MKLGNKLNLIVVSVFLLTVILYSSIVIPLQKKNLSRVTDKVVVFLETISETNMKPLANEIFENRTRAISIRLDFITSIEGISGAAVFNNNKDLVTGKNIISDRDWSRLLSDHGSGIQDKTSWTDENTIWFIKKIEISGELFGYLLILFPLKDVSEDHTNSIKIFAITIFTTMGVILFVMNILVKKIVIGPVNELKKNMQSLEFRKTDTWIKRISNDEIGDLTDRFNRMSEEIVTSYMEIEKSHEEVSRIKKTLENIINSMPSALIGVDREGVVTQWNSKAASISGISFSNAAGKPLTQVFPNLVDEMDQIHKAILTGQVILIPRKLYEEDSETRFEDITIYPLITNKVEGAVIRIDDVTGKVRMEEMIVQTEKMISVGGLAASMAHEINNPLAGVLQTSSVLLNRLDDLNHIPANHEAAKSAGTTVDAIHSFMEFRGVPGMLHRIHEMGERMAVIVENMLSFTRKSHAEVSPQNMSDLIDKTLELAVTDFNLEKQFDFKMIKIIRKLDKNLPPVLCERPKIQQVLLNILRNGAYAMQEAGTKDPTIKIQTYCKVNPDRFCIEITDNGPGMDDATRKRVFEPFYTTKHVGVGTGLGLSVSYFIITDNHHGEMSVRSSPGAGSTFTICLPMNAKNL